MPKPPTLRVERVRGGDARFAAAKNAEYEIFGLENGYTSTLDNAAGAMTQYAAWERSSEFFLGFLDTTPEVPASVLRALRFDPTLGIESFSTVRDSRRFPMGDTVQNRLYPTWDRFFDDVDPATVAELATQAVRRRVRRQGVMEQTWQTFFTAAAAEGVRYITVALVVPLFRWYQLIAPNAIHQIGELLPDYVGADSIPAVLDLAKLGLTIANVDLADAMRHP